MEQSSWSRHCHGEVPLISPESPLAALGTVGSISRPKMPSIGPEHEEEIRSNSQSMDQQTDRPRDVEHAVRTFSEQAQRDFPLKGFCEQLTTSTNRFSILPRSSTPPIPAPSACPTSTATNLVSGIGVSHLAGLVFTSDCTGCHHDGLITERRLRAVRELRGVKRAPTQPK
jgi:hypothetical protein